MSVIAVFVIIGVALLIVIFTSIFFFRLSKQENLVSPENKTDKKKLPNRSGDTNNLDQN